MVVFLLILNIYFSEMDVKKDLIKRYIDSVNTLECDAALREHFQLKIEDYNPKVFEEEKQVGVPLTEYSICCEAHKDIYYFKQNGFKYIIERFEESPEVSRAFKVRVGGGAEMPDNLFVVHFSKEGKYNESITFTLGEDYIISAMGTETWK
jgi:hypothetical protein